MDVFFFLLNFPDSLTKELNVYAEELREKLFMHHVIKLGWGYEYVVYIDGSL